MPLRRDVDLHRTAGDQSTISAAGLIDRGDVQNLKKAGKIEDVLRAQWCSVQLIVEQAAPPPKGRPSDVRNSAP